MRSVRMRLLMSHLILVLMLGIVMSAAIASFVSLEGSIDRVLEGNYKSISAGHQMQNGLMLDLAGYGEHLIGNSLTARTRFREGLFEFKSGLTEAKQSVNEIGESEVLQKLDREYLAHRKLVDSVAIRDRLTDEDRERFALDESVHYFALRGYIEELIDINRRAMQRESNRAKNLVGTSAQRSIAIAGTALLLAIVMTIGLSRSILRPLRKLAASAEQIGKGQNPPPVQIKQGDELGTLATAFNAMTDRLDEARSSVQRKLLRAEKMSDIALESLYDPVIVTDAKGRIVFFNKAAEGLFGPSPDAPRNPVISDISDEIIMKAIYGVMQDDHASAAEDETSQVPITVGESNRTYRLRATPMKDNDGQLLGSVTVLEDITHLKEVDRLKSEFIGVASHELRTPVASLLMSVQLLEEGAVGDLTEAQQQIVALQKQDLERLKKLMSELLDLSKLEAGTQRMVVSSADPAELIKAAIGTCRPHAADNRVRLDMEIDPDLQHIRVDKGQIERVLINLILNAIRHTPPKGQVIVRAINEPNQVTFTVEDNGEGIPDEYVAKVFDRFVQVPGATGGGAGLGLSIAQNIVKVHGGEIWADSNIGEGSSFHFSLPIDRATFGD